MTASEIGFEGTTSLRCVSGDECDNVGTLTCLYAPFVLLGLLEEAEGQNRAPALDTSGVISSITFSLQLSHRHVTRAPCGGAERPPQGRDVGSGSLMRARSSLTPSCRMNPFGRHWTLA